MSLALCIYWGDEYVENKSPPTHGPHLPEYIDCPHRQHAWLSIFYIIQKECIASMPIVSQNLYISLSVRHHY